MKRFNTTGTCFPSIHYMVNIDRQVQAAAKLVRQGDYFCINRGRQYGKTTTLAALADLLKDEYCVFSISFEGLSDSSFATAENACAEFLKILKQFSRVNGSTAEMQSLLKKAVPIGRKEIDPTDFTDIIEELCTLSAKPLVVMIDEVDQASNNEGFIKFLGVLRKMYLARETFRTFQSVILAGVYDIKNLKHKIRPDDRHQYNSPWNIAVPFQESMDLPADGIADMLEEFRNDHNIDFDSQYIAQLIYDYTSGYPFLVSRICQIIDTSDYSWDKEGVLNAVHTLLSERNTLFDDMVKKLEEFPDLKDVMKHILYSGSRYSYNPDEKYIQIAMMFNFVKENQGTLSVSSRILETRMYNYFLSEEKMSGFYKQGELEKNQFIHDGIVDMRHLIEQFSIHFTSFL